jgi:hypothetical protein
VAHRPEGKLKVQEVPATRSLNAVAVAQPECELGTSGKAAAPYTGAAYLLRARA